MVTPCGCAGVAPVVDCFLLSNTFIANSQCAKCCERKEPLGGTQVIKMFIREAGLLAEGIGDSYIKHHATKTYGEVEVSHTYS
jgi:hypothetical protein